MGHHWLIGRIGRAVALASLLAPCHAAQAETFEVPDSLLLEYYMPNLDLPADMQIETRLYADLNGDGVDDVAFVAGNEDKRVVGVLIAYVDEFDRGHTPAGVAQLAPDRLGPASLSAPKGVLVVGDLTGGTSAIASTYRYRFEAKSKRMRLIGDDVKRYSRTNSHGWDEISTNRLTGLQIRKSADLDDAGAYVEKPEKRGKVPTAPLYMETAPDPETTLGGGQ